MLFLWFVEHVVLHVKQRITYGKNAIQFRRLMKIASKIQLSKCWLKKDGPAAQKQYKACRFPVHRVEFGTGLLRQCLERICYLLSIHCFHINIFLAPDFIFDSDCVNWDPSFLHSDSVTVIRNTVVLKSIFSQRFAAAYALLCCTGVCGCVWVDGGPHSSQVRCVWDPSKRRCKKTNCCYRFKRVFEQVSLTLSVCFVTKCNRFSPCQRIFYYRIICMTKSNLLKR